MVMEKLKANIIVVSDTAYKDPVSDKSGRVLTDVLAVDGSDSWLVEPPVIVPDNVLSIQKEIQKAADREDPANLIVTTGGTGFAIKDITPEAVSSLIEKQANGIVHAMLAASLQVTPFAAMSRPVAGVRNKTLILTLPGSPKGAEENLQAIIKLLPHACLQAAGEDSRKLHVGGVKQLEKDVGIRVRYEESVEGPPNQKHYHHDEHTPGHSSHAVPMAHTKPEDRPVSNDPLAGPTNRHRQSPYPMISAQEAIKLVLRHTPKPKPTMAHVNSNLLGFILAEDVRANEDVPAFRASIVDGYAARNLSQGIFKVASISHAAPSEPPTIQEDEVVRITTGAALPRGAKSVFMVEDTIVRDTTSDGKEEATVEVLTNELHPGENVREIGSDVRKGDVILRKGDEITAVGGEIGLLSSVGVSSAVVYEKPVVAVLSTGDELVEHDKSSPLLLGQVRDTNRPALLAAIRAWGYEAIDLGIARDNSETLETILRSALRRCSVIVTTGGVSMGELDLLKPTIERSLGGIIHFGRVSMKPGKPTTFATVPFKSNDGDRNTHRLIFSLPGNPASAMVTLHLFILPSLRKAKGVKELEVSLPKCLVVMDEDVKCDPKREEYCRAMVTAGIEGKLHAKTTGGQRSSRIGSLSGANALLVLPLKNGLMRKGEQAHALMMSQVNGI